MKTGFVGNFQPRWHSECISPMVECISHHDWVYIPPWLSVYPPMVEFVSHHGWVISHHGWGKFSDLQYSDCWVDICETPPPPWRDQENPPPPYCYPKKLFTPLKAFFLENSPPPILLIGGTVKRNIKGKGVDKVADFIIRTSD